MAQLGPTREARELGYLYTNSCLPGLRAAPGGVNSSLLRPQDSKKIKLLTDGTPPSLEHTELVRPKGSESSPYMHLPQRPKEGGEGGNMAKEKKTRARAVPFKVSYPQVSL